MVPRKGLVQGLGSSQPRAETPSEATGHKLWPHGVRVRGGKRACVRALMCAAVHERTLRAGRNHLSENDMLVI